MFIFNRKRFWNLITCFHRQSTGGRTSFSRIVTVVIDIYNICNKPLTGPLASELLTLFSNKFRTTLVRTRSASWWLLEMKQSMNETNIIIVTIREARNLTPKDWRWTHVISFRNMFQDAFENKRILKDGTKESNMICEIHSLLYIHALLILIITNN